MGQIFSKDTTMADIYASYGSHHYNTVNKVLHIVSIPIIVGSIIGMGQSAPMPTNFRMPYFGFRPLWIHLFAAHTAVPIYYDAPSGLATLLMYFGLATGAERIHTAIGDSSKSFWFFFTTHALAWAAQFFGHYAFEKREPRLLSHPAEVFTAPTFVVMEVLFKLGYKPKLAKECEEKVLAAINSTEHNYI